MSKYYKLIVDRREIICGSVYILALNYMLHAMLSGLDWKVYLYEDHIIMRIY